MRRNRLWKWTIVSLGVLLCVGCGPVHLSSMAPEAWKPSALFVLDGKVTGWQPSDIERVATESSVVTESVYAAPNAVLQRLNSSVTLMPHVGLFVVVSNQVIPNTVLNWATSHLPSRLEWISPGSVSTSAANVRQLTSGGVGTGYLLGFLASSLTSPQVGAVGWDIVGTTPSTRQVVQAAMGGSYVANASVRNIPVSLTALAGVGKPIRFPQVVVVDHPLSVAEASFALQQGVTLISLVPQSVPGSMLAASPALPGPEAALPDLSLFRHLKWTSGQVVAQTAPWIQVNAVLPSSVQAALQSQESVLQGNPQWATSAWSLVPGPIRQSFVSILPG